MAPTDDTHLETNADGNDNTFHDALVEKLITVQQNAYQACLQSAVAEINRRVDCFMRETTTALTELRISFQYTQTQVEELKVNQSKENIVVVGLVIKGYNPEPVVRVGLVIKGYNPEPVVRVGLGIKGYNPEPVVRVGLGIA